MASTVDSSLIVLPTPVSRPSPRVFLPPIGPFSRCDVPLEVFAGVPGQGCHRLRDWDPERAREQQPHIPYLRIYSYTRGKRRTGVEIFNGQQRVWKYENHRVRPQLGPERSIPGPGDPTGDFPVRWCSLPLLRWKIQPAEHIPTRVPFEGGVLHRVHRDVRY